MIVDLLTDIKSSILFYRINGFLKEHDIFLKLEGLNIAGSIKLKPALWLVEKLESQSKLIQSKSTVICSSSGNLGIALAIVCKQKKYPFICVSDPNILTISKNYIELYGGKVIQVTKSDNNGGYLATRLTLIDELLNKYPHYVFVDQYNNEENINVHFSLTANEILLNIPQVDYLFVGAGTTGTLMGCAKLFKEKSPRTRIIAVDALGSVTFGFAPGKRHIPGLGTSKKPEIVDINYIDDVILISEIDTIRTCHEILQLTGLFLGGSSGTVIAGIKQMEDKLCKSATVVAIAPDFGDRYLDTIYSPHWIKKNYSNLLL